jgi:hypothetical protein
MPGSTQYAVQIYLCPVIKQATSVPDAFCRCSGFDMEGGYCG